MSVKKFDYFFFTTREVRRTVPSNLNGQEAVNNIMLQPADNRFDPTLICHGHLILGRPVGTVSSLIDYGQEV